MDMKQDARRYVGGNWQEAGKRQLDFLIKEGLKPDNILLDLGCGNFRSGRFFIKYLDDNNYYGIEHHQWLVDAGFEEIGGKLKTVIVNDNFDFRRFNKPFDFVIAKSVFTHLTEDRIRECLCNLRTILKPNGVFYASISEGNSSKNPLEDHDNKRFRYTIEEMKSLAEGWNVESMGNAGCFKQTMLKFTIKSMKNISIITAGFSVKYINGTWESIKKQTLKSWEWILVCDNSDKIREWYKKQDFTDYNVWFIDIGKSQGRYGLSARNVGAICASYNNIVFLDDDNSFEEKDYLEELIETKIRTGKIPYTKLHIIGKKEGSTVNRIKDTSLNRHQIDLGNLLYNKEHFLKTGYFDDSKNRIMFDFDKIYDIITMEGVENFIKIDRHLLFRHKRY